MTDRTVKTSPQAYARIVGAAYVITMLLGIFCVNYLESNIVVPGDNAATVDNITTSEMLFRICVAGELMMFALVVLLSWALYVILRTVNRNLALLALLWRLAEAITGGCVTVLSGLIPLLLLHTEPSLKAEQLQSLTGSFLAVRNAGLDIVLIFIGMGGTVFSYLLFKSKYVPRILARRSKWLFTRQAGFLS